MKKFTMAAGLVAFLAVATLFLGLVYHPLTIWAAQDLLLADRHKDAGITCEGCHKENPPEKKSPMEVCIECHGNYDRIAGLTQKSLPNPHDSHLGEVDCGYCHHAHKPSENFCSSCHNFGFKVP